MIKKLLLSEGRTVCSKSELDGLRDAWLYLKPFLNDENRGFIEEELLNDINGRLLSRTKSTYSYLPRITVFENKCKVYTHPSDIASRMRMLIDRYNYDFNFVKTIEEALCQFVIDFLQVHPYSDGNGRTIKMVIWYVMKSKYNIECIEFIDYSPWCELVYWKNYEDILHWLRQIKNHNT